MEQAAGSLKRGIVDVVMPRKDDEAFFFSEFSNFLELVGGGSDGLFNEDMFFVFQSQYGVLGVRFEGGQDKDGVDFRIGDQFGGGLIGDAAERFSTFFIEFCVDRPEAFQFGSLACVNCVGMEN